MSSKRYEYKILESSDLSEIEQQLTTIGNEGWAAVGYGVLPNGSRSVLLQRKQHDHDEHHHDHHHGDHHGSHRHERGERRQ